jgi:quinol monooxygenase YgiN
MVFDPKKVRDFKLLFEEVHPKILAFEGCKHVELCADANEANVYYTFSKWEDEQALENYRSSEFFEDTWSRTKVLFGGKPEAFSLLSELNCDQYML